MTSQPDFAEAARAEAMRRNPPIDRHPDDFTYPRSALREHKRGAFEAGAEWARAYLTERCTACGEDPSGPLRPLTTDERSFRYAQDLGYELPEDPR